LLATECRVVSRVGVTLFLCTMHPSITHQQLVTHYHHHHHHHQLTTHPPAHPPTRIDHLLFPSPCIIYNHNRWPTPLTHFNHNRPPPTHPPTHPPTQPTNHSPSTHPPTQPLTSHPPTHPPTHLTPHHPSTHPPNNLPSTYPPTHRPLTTTGLELNVASTPELSPVNFVDDAILDLPTRDFAHFLKTVDPQTASAIKAARRRKKVRPSLLLAVTRPNLQPAPHSRLFILSSYCFYLLFGMFRAFRVFLVLSNGSLWT
jgi:hypothetical protein